MRLLLLQYHLLSSNSIIHVGAKPVFVDVGEDLNINPDLIEKQYKKLKQYYCALDDRMEIWRKFLK